MDKVEEDKRAVCVWMCGVRAFTGDFPKLGDRGNKE